MPVTSDYTLSIIMPCYNRAYDLQRVLRAYDEQVGAEPFEVIAIDDASHDATFQALSAYQPRTYTLRVERQEKNQGPAAARNRGIGLAQAPVILFVGDDILPEVNLVRGHQITHALHPEKSAAILGKVTWGKDFPVNTLMKHIDGIGAQQFSYHYLKDNQEYDFRHLYTANVSLKKEMLLEQPVWFDSEFPLAAFEDVELSYRMAQRGLHIRYMAPLIGYHYHYHTIWSFARRQYNAGLMGCVMVKKHPELAETVLSKNWQKRLMLWKTATRMHLFKPQVYPWLEAQALHVANAYEWTTSPLLDFFYLQILSYFYFKGLIDGTFSDPAIAAPLHNAHAHQVLYPALSRFLLESDYLDDPAHAGEDSLIANPLIDLNNPLIELFFKRKERRLLAARQRKPHS